MARTQAGAALTAQHRQGQLRVRAAAMRDFTRLWPLWRGDRRSFERLVGTTVPLVRAHHRLSASVAASYFQAFRLAEGVPGSAAPRLADPVSAERVTASLFVTGAEMTRRAIAAGHSPQAAMQTALVRTSGAVARHALKGGRDTLVLSAGEDREAGGWARVTAGEPCAWCAMQASRGPVFSEDTASFQAHDACSCAAEPHYEGSEWPGRAREFRALWNEATPGAENPLNEFRRALGNN